MMVGFLLHVQTKLTSDNKHRCFASQILDPSLDDVKRCFVWESAVQIRLSGTAACGLDQFPEAKNWIRQCYPAGLPCAGKETEGRRDEAGHPGDTG